MNFQAPLSAIISTRIEGLCFGKLLPTAAGLDIHFPSDSHVLTGNTTFKINVTTRQWKNLQPHNQYTKLPSTSTSCSLLLWICVLASFGRNNGPHIDITWFVFVPSLLTQFEVVLDLMVGDFQFPVLREAVIEHNGWCARNCTSNGIILGWNLTSFDCGIMQH